MNKNTGNRYFLLKASSGLSLVEAMVGMVIFFLIFGFTMNALTPTATASHNLIRGTTLAMSACNWYLNDLERRINYDGKLPASALGEKYITNSFSESLFPDLPMLRCLEVVSKIELDDNLYSMKIAFRWGNHERDLKRPHRFEMVRLKAKPGI